MYIEFSSRSTCTKKKNDLRFYPNKNTVSMPLNATVPPCSVNFRNINSIQNDFAPCISMWNESGACPLFTKMMNVCCCCCCCCFAFYSSIFFSRIFDFIPPPSIFDSFDVIIKSSIVTYNLVFFSFDLYISVEIFQNFLFYMKKEEKNGLMQMFLSSTFSISKRFESKLMRI